MTTILQTPRLRLRPPAVADARAVAGHLANWDVTRMLAMPPWPFRIDDAERFLAVLVLRAQDQPAITLALTLPPDDTVIGMADLVALDARPTLGYWLGEPYWGAGLMTEALTALIGHVLARRPIDTIYSGVFHDNPASLAVQRKLGFAVTGESVVYSVPRNLPLRHIDTELTRAAFLAATSGSATR